MPAESRCGALTGSGKSVPDSRRRRNVKAPRWTPRGAAPPTSSPSDRVADCGCDSPAWRAPWMRPATSPHPSASGRAASTWVTCRPLKPLPAARSQSPDEGASATGFRTSGYWPRPGGWWARRRPKCRRRRRDPRPWRGKMADHDDRIEHQHGGGADAFLGRGSHVNGTLVFRGAVHIEGDVEGEIAADGVVTIAASAVVNARIAATSIVIQGRVTGEIVARERLEIRGPARVSGSVATPRLVIHEGAVFEGRCTM